MLVMLSDSPLELIQTYRLQYDAEKFTNTKISIKIPRNTIERPTRLPIFGELPSSTDYKLPYDHTEPRIRDPLDIYCQRNFNNAEEVIDATQPKNLNEANPITSDQGITPADTISEQRFPTEMGTSENEQTGTDQPSLGRNNEDSKNLIENAEEGDPSEGQTENAENQKADQSGTDERKSGSTTHTSRRQQNRNEKIPGDEFIGEKVTDKSSTKTKSTAGEQMSGGKEPINRSQEQNLAVDPGIVVDEVVEEMKESTGEVREKEGDGMVGTAETDAAAEPKNLETEAGAMEKIAQEFGTQNTHSDESIEDASVKFSATMGNVPIEVNFQHTTVKGPRAPDQTEITLLEFQHDGYPSKSQTSSQQNMELTMNHEDMKTAEPEDGFSSIRKLTLKNRPIEQDPNIMEGKARADDSEEWLTNYTHRPRSNLTSVAFRYRYKAMNSDDVRKLKTRDKTEDGHLSVTPTTKSIYWRVTHSPVGASELKNNKAKPTSGMQEEFRYFDSGTGLQMEQQYKLVGSQVPLEESDEAPSPTPAIEGADIPTKQVTTEQDQEAEPGKPPATTNMADLLLESTLLMHTSTGSELGLFVHGSQEKKPDALDDTAQPRSLEEPPLDSNPIVETEGDINQLSVPEQPSVDDELSESKEVTMPISTQDPSQANVVDLMGYRLTSEQSADKSIPKTPMQSIATNSVKVVESTNAEPENEESEAKESDTTLRQEVQDAQPDLSVSPFAHMEITINMTAGTATTEAHLRLEGPMWTKVEASKGIPLTLEQNTENIPMLPNIQDNSENKLANQDEQPETIDREDAVEDPKVEEYQGKENEGEVKLTEGAVVENVTEQADSGKSGTAEKDEPSYETKLSVEKSQSEMGENGAEPASPTVEQSSKPVEEAELRIEGKDVEIDKKQNDAVTRETDNDASIPEEHKPENVIEELKIAPTEACENDVPTAAEQALIKLLVTIERKIEGQPYTTVSYKADIPVTVQSTQVQNNVTLEKVPPAISVEAETNTKDLGVGGVSLDINAAGLPISSVRDLSSMEQMDICTEVKTHHSFDSEPPSGIPIHTMQSLSSMDQAEISMVKTNYSLESETTMIEGATFENVTSTDPSVRKQQETAERDLEPPVQLENSTKKPEPIIQFTQTISMKDKTDTNLLTLTITSSFLCPQASQPAVETNQLSSNSVNANQPEPPPEVSHSSKSQEGSDKEQKQPWTSMIRASTLEFFMNPDHAAESSDEEDLLSVASEPMLVDEDASDDTDCSVASEPAQSTVFLETLRTSVLLLGQTGKRSSMNGASKLKNRLRQSRRFSRAAFLTEAQMKFGRKASRHKWQSVHKARAAKKSNKAEKPSVQNKKENKAIDWDDSDAMVKEERKLEKNSSAAEQFRITWEERIIAHYNRKLKSTNAKLSETEPTVEQDTKPSSRERQHRLFRVTATLGVEYGSISSSTTSQNPCVSLKPLVHQTPTKDLPCRSSSSCASEQIFPPGVRLEFDETLVTEEAAPCKTTTNDTSKEKTATDKGSKRTSTGSKTSRASIRCRVAIESEIPVQENLVKFREQTARVCTCWNIIHDCSVPRLDPAYSSRLITIALPSKTRRSTIITFQRSKPTTTSSTPPPQQSYEDSTPTLCHCPAYQPALPLVMTPTFGVPTYFRPISYGPSPTGYLQSCCGNAPAFIPMLDNPELYEQPDVIFVQDGTPATPMACPHSPSEASTFLRMSPQWDTYQFEWSETEHRNAGDKRTQTPKIDKEEELVEHECCKECSQCTKVEQSERQCSVVCAEAHPELPEYRQGSHTPLIHSSHPGSPYTQIHQGRLVQRMYLPSGSSVGATYTVYGTPIQPNQSAINRGYYRIKSQVIPTGNMKHGVSNTAQHMTAHLGRNSENQRANPHQPSGIRFEKREPTQQESRPVDLAAENITETQPIGADNEPVTTE